MCVYNGQEGNSVFGGACRLDKKGFVFFSANILFLTLYRRGNYFLNLTLIGLGIKMYHDKENNILRTKACGRHAFCFLRTLSLRFF